MLQVALVLDTQARGPGSALRERRRRERLCERGDRLLLPHRPQLLNMRSGALSPHLGLHKHRRRVLQLAKFDLRHRVEVTSGCLCLCTRRNVYGQSIRPLLRCVNPHQSVFNCSLIMQPRARGIP